MNNLVETPCASYYCWSPGAVERKRRAVVPSSPFAAARARRYHPLFPFGEQCKIRVELQCENRASKWISRSGL